MDLRVIKNVLDRKTFAALEEKLFKEFNSFPWYYAPHLVAGDDYFHLVHNFCANDRVNSPFYSNFLPVLKILNPKRLIRMRGSLLGRTHEKEKHVFHTDFKNCRTALFYLNTTNGPTFFKNGPPVPCEKNTLVEFNSNLAHASSSCTDKKIRIVINFNYIPKND